jgi:hypothetical protein
LGISRLRIWLGFERVTGEQIKEKTCKETKGKGVCKAVLVSHLTAISGAVPMNLAASLLIS